MDVESQNGAGEIDPTDGVQVMRIELEPRTWRRTVLDGLSRGQLLELAAALAVVDPDATEDDDVYPEDVVATMTRMDLIDRIVGVVDLEESADDPEPDYPVRREPASTVPGWLTSVDSARVVLCRESDVDGALSALVGDDSVFGWNVGGELRAGDIVVTVLDTSPELLVAIELVEHDEAERLVIAERHLLRDPLSWDTVLLHARTDISRFVGPLSLKASRELLEVIEELLYAQTPLVIAAGCRPGEGTSDAVRAAYFLRAEAEGWGMECASCHREVDLAELELHFDRPSEAPLRLDIAEHVDDVAPLCRPCHVLASAHPVAVQETLLRPACPDCGARSARPILWGMPASPPPEGWAMGGCAVPIGPTPQWACGECDARYLVVSVEELRRWGVMA